MNQILELFHGSFNSAVIKLFQQLVTNFLETNENKDLSKVEPRALPYESELDCERNGSRMAPYLLAKQLEGNVELAFN